MLTEKSKKAFGFFALEASYRQKALDTFSKVEEKEFTKKANTCFELANYNLK
jgi:hypothetical protein